MPTYLLVDISVSDPERFREYVRLAPPIEEHGGTWLVRGVPAEALEGEWRPQRFSLARFPDAQHVKDYFATPGYAAARAVREGATTAWMALVDGDDVPQGTGGYIIVDVAVTDPEGYQTYLPLVGPTLAAYDGVTISRGAGQEVLEGARQPARLILVAFPSVDRACDWWDSDAYAPAKAIRQQAARTDMLVVAGASA